MKKVLLIPVLVLVLTLPLMNAFADNSPLRDYFSNLPVTASTAAPSRTGLVTDDTGNLTAREIEALEETCREIGDRYGLVVMIRLVNSDRWYVSVTTGRGERALPSQRLDACEDAAQPYLKSGRYYDAFSAYLKKLDYYLDRYWDSSADPTGWEPEKPSVYTGGGYTARQPEDPMTRLMKTLPVIGIVSAAITGIVLLCVRHSMRTARKKDDAGNYISQARITARQDLYLYTSQTRRRIETSSSSSSGHGGGGHFSSGGGGHGSSHGGRF